ncbi:MAG: twin-arginine translocation signal domain-containing protein [Bryobacteraceae bacterium]|nr:twin-arginine translocation signal domain-containing protein [Bryobacteraceae bacterium]
MVQPQSRRGFLKAAAAAPAVFTSRWAERARPNVLFIICDDLNDSVQGMGGHPQAHTPNIHSLMQRGFNSPARTTTSRGARRAHEHVERPVSVHEPISRRGALPEAPAARGPCFSQPAPDEERV